jgi:hypothetical protein
VSQVRVSARACVCVHALVCDLRLQSQLAEERTIEAGNCRNTETSPLPNGVTISGPYNYNPTTKFTVNAQSGVCGCARVCVRDRVRVSLVSCVHRA